MQTTQMPNVAGIFYPEEPKALRQTLQHLLQQVKPPAPEALPAKAIIAPHAGYIYSGPIAASAYAQLIPLASQLQQIVVLAPSHRVAFRGLAVPSAQQFATPLGTIPVATKVLEPLLRLPQVIRLDAAFAHEHALEVQLPFLQVILDDFALIPLIVGEATAEEVAQVLETLWGDAHTLIVISSDLSHYLDYASAVAKDKHTSDLIVAMDQHLAADDACGRYPIRGLLRAAQRHGLSAQLLDLRNSGDTAGDRSRVVGYGAYVFH